MTVSDFSKPIDLDHLVRILATFTNYEKNRDFHKGRIRCDLEKIRSLCRAAGDPQLKVPCIHITGSKGKGSTALMLEKILRSQGLKTGLFTSPHLNSLTERIALNGEPLPEEVFIHQADRILDLLRKDPGLKPTFFEFITAMAMNAFYELGVEAAIFEVGLGGRLDATNVVLPEVAVITSLELEHTAVLGHTLEEIAGEKAGIIKEKVPLVTAVPLIHPGRAIIAKKAREAGAPLTGPGQGLEWDFSDREELFLRIGKERLGPFFPPAPLALQASNMACAVTAARIFLECRNLSWDGIAASRALKGLSLPGRFEVMAQKPLVVLDGAHTPSSVKAGLEEMTRVLGQAPVVVLGLAEDKDGPGILEPLLAGVKALFFTPYAGGRAFPPQDLQKMAGGRGELTDDPVKALERAKAAAGAQGGVLVTGSFYLAGELRERYFPAK
ncbi:MAG: bifunctional folylpolyglutamate synthase/dihydrofolate synthase [Planctomycetes bacterium]|nr:bifunctional folylpolyglutamate synthase/dihydrofolate synthase [Planctomycetota bacterium]